MALRILYHAMVELDLPDGHAIHTREICSALAEAGHSVTLAAPRAAAPPSAPRLTSLPLRFHGFGGFRLRLYRKLARLRLEHEVARARPDVRSPRERSVASATETWLSGRKQPPAKRLGGVELPHRFESCRLRRDPHDSLPR